MTRPLPRKGPDVAMEQIYVNAMPTRVIGTFMVIVSRGIRGIGAFLFLAKWDIGLYLFRDMQYWSILWNTGRQ